MRGRPDVPGGGGGRGRRLGAGAAAYVRSRRGECGDEGVGGRLSAAVLHRAGSACDERAGPQPVRGALDGLVPVVRRFRRSPRRRARLCRAARGCRPEAGRPAAPVGAVGWPRPLLRGLGARGGGVPGRIDGRLARGVAPGNARHGVARGSSGARARASLAPARLRGGAGGVRLRVRGRIGSDAVRGVAARGPLGAARALRAHVPRRFRLHRAPGALRDRHLRRPRGLGRGDPLRESGRLLAGPRGGGGPRKAMLFAAGAWLGERLHRLRRVRLARALA